MGFMNRASTPDPTPEDDPEIDQAEFFMNSEAWDWLMKRLDEPPEPNPRLVELFAKARRLEHRPDAGPKADLPCKDDDSFWHLLQMERRQ